MAIAGNAPIGQVDDAVALLGQAQIVRDHQHGAAKGLVEVAQQLEHLGRRAAVKVARGLVGQQQRRLGHQGAGHGHALLLPARELVGALLRQLL